MLRAYSDALRFLNTFTDVRSQLNPGQNSTTPNNMYLSEGWFARWR